jgi:hypothetical protein
MLSQLDCEKPDDANENKKKASRNFFIAVLENTFNPFEDG